MVLVKIPVFYNMVPREKLRVTTVNILVGRNHQDWVHSLSFPSLKILQDLYKRKLNSTTQFSHRRGVTGPPTFDYLILQTKKNI